MVAVLLRQTTSFATTHSYAVKAVDVQLSCGEEVHRVGDYVADYSELTLEEMSATDPALDELLARSRVVSTKRL